MSIRQRKNKKRTTKSKPSKPNQTKFWRKFRLGFGTKAQAKKALQNRDSDIILGEEE